MNKTKSTSTHGVGASDNKPFVINNPYLQSVPPAVATTQFSAFGAAAATGNPFGATTPSGNPFGSSMSSTSSTSGTSGSSSSATSSGDLAPQGRTERRILRGVRTRASTPVAPLPASFTSEAPAATDNPFGATTPSGNPFGSNTSSSATPSGDSVFVFGASSGTPSSTSSTSSDVTPMTVTYLGEPKPTFTPASSSATTTSAPATSTTIPDFMRRDFTEYNRLVALTKLKPEYTREVGLYFIWSDILILKACLPIATTYPFGEDMCIKILQQNNIPFVNEDVRELTKWIVAQTQRMNTEMTGYNELSKNLPRLPLQTNIPLSKVIASMVKHLQSVHSEPFSMFTLGKLPFIAVLSEKPQGQEYLKKIIGIEGADSSKWQEILWNRLDFAQFPVIYKKLLGLGVIQTQLWHDKLDIPLMTTWFTYLKNKQQHWRTIQECYNQVQTNVGVLMSDKTQMSAAKNATNSLHKLEKLIFEQQTGFYPLFVQSKVPQHGLNAKSLWTNEQFVNAEQAASKSALPFGCDHSGIYKSLDAKAVLLHFSGPVEDPKLYFWSPLIGILQKKIKDILAPSTLTTESTTVTTTAASSSMNSTGIKQVTIIMPPPPPSPVTTTTQESKPKEQPSKVETKKSETKEELVKVQPSKLETKKSDTRKTITAVSKDEQSKRKSEVEQTEIKKTKKQNDDETLYVSIIEKVKKDLLGMLATKKFDEKGDEVDPFVIGAGDIDALDFLDIQKQTMS